MRIIVGLMMATFLSFGCSKLSLFSPSGTNTGNPNYKDLKYWYPCVVVQTPGFNGTRDFETQMTAVKKLHRAGRMDWIRLGDVSVNRVGQDYAIAAKGEGINVFAIMDIVDLRVRESWEASFDELYRMFPEVDIWEIGGEISNSSINPETITPEYYMEKFKSLRNYVGRKYGESVGRNLTSAPTLGSGGGPTEFRRFIELGLLDMDVIIAVNIYDFSSNGSTFDDYANIFSKFSDKFRHRTVWITETGSHTRENQVNYVETRYEQFRNTIKAKMVCHYVLWDGDNIGYAGNSLLNNVMSGELEYTELFKRLAGEN